MKYKCRYIYHSDTFIIADDESKAYYYDMKQYKPDDQLTIEVKKYKPVRTLTQNAFFHKTVGYLAFKLGMDAVDVKEGIKSMYGYKMRVYGGDLIPKPSSQCNKFEEMSALIEGCFREAGEQSIDMRDYVLQWERFKKERKKTLDKNADNV